jgi:hypothetical protein
MHRKLRSASLAVLVVALLAASASFAQSAPPPAANPGSGALFEGQRIDLSQGWGQAQACLVDNAISGTECFRDRQGVNVPEAELGIANTAVPTIVCLTSLRLFADSSYGGRELDFYDRAGRT